MDSLIDAVGPAQAKTSTESLSDALAASLPEAFKCKVCYIHTTPRSCDPLFSPPPGHEAEKTRLASHFLAVSLSRDESEGDVLVLGIEVLVYTTKRLTTIFVSKADSTGYLPPQRPSPIKVIATTFLRWLAAEEHRKASSRKLVVSLFARAQSQYLFPGSAENTGKHVLDDRQLIKWWARVLDPFFPVIYQSPEAAELHYTGYVTIPGYSGVEIRPFLPPPSSSGGSQNWRAGDPLNELARRRGVPAGAPPRCYLPRFPDDPKARFIQDLDDEVGMAEETASAMTSPSKRTGKWKSIGNLDQFWQAMEFRQECSSGRLVGFLWLVIQKRHQTDAPSNLDEAVVPESHSQVSVDSAAVDDGRPSRRRASTTNRDDRKRRRRPLSGPIVARQPRLKGGSSSRSATSDLNGMLSTGLQEGLFLTKEGYDTAMHTLLHLDFANVGVAAQSTKKWMMEVSSIGNVQRDWAVPVIGTAKVQASSGQTGRESAHGQVTDLGNMVRKKRTANDAARGAAGAAAMDQPIVNILSSSMVRKKAKVQ